MAKNEDDIKIEWNGNVVRVHGGSGMTAADWTAEIVEDCVEYNQPAPAPIDLTDPVRVGLIEMNHLDLYMGWQKINAMIKGAHDRRQRDITTLRNTCQTWIDDVRFRENIPQGHYWMDRVRYFLRGKNKQRRDFLYLFSLIIWDICTRLNEIDGGPDLENVPQQSHIGFNQR